jgi:ABC-type transport system involved in multi-copper enzyme maturation permease subunit
MRAVMAIASATVGEAIRRRVLLVILLIGLLFLVIAPALNILSPRQERSVLVGLTLGVIQLTSALIAIMLTVYLIPNEVERRTIYTILCKPVQRWQFLLGKYLGAVSALGMMIGLMSIVLVITFMLATRAPFEAALPLIKGPLMNFFQMSMLAALAIMLSTSVSPLVNIFISAGVYLVGTLFSPVFQTISESADVPRLTKGFSTLIYSIVPNFASFNVQNPLINPGQTITDERVYFVQTIGYAILYIVVFLIIGAIRFEYKEV